MISKTLPRNPMKNFKDFRRSIKEETSSLEPPMPVKDVVSPKMGKNLSFDGYTTKNFDVDSNAYDAFLKLISSYEHESTSAQNGDHPGNTGIVKPRQIRHMQAMHYLTL